MCVWGGSSERENGETQKRTNEDKMESAQWHWRSFGGRNGDLISDDLYMLTTFCIGRERGESIGVQ
jgi:hypothetical protein